MNSDDLSDLKSLEQDLIDGMTPRNSNKDIVVPFNKSNDVRKVNL